MQAIMLLFTVRKWITEDRQSKTLEAVDGGGSKPPKFSRVVLNAWDFTTCTREVCFGYFIIPSSVGAFSSYMSTTVLSTTAHQ
jgi:hypothetical protein